MSDETPWDDVPLFDEPPPWAQAPAATRDAATGLVYDAATGEVMTPEPTEAVTGDVLHLAADQASVAAIADDLPGWTVALRTALEERVADEYSALLAARDQSAPIDVAVGPELRYLANAVETFETVANVFTEAARHAKQTAGDVALETRPEDATRIQQAGGSTSLRIGRRNEGGEGSVKVTVTQRTKVVTDTPALVRVILERLTMYNIDDDIDIDSLADAYQYGAISVLSVVQELTSPWTWKTSALDIYGRSLPEELRAEFYRAYHRAPVGEASTRIETTQ